VVVAVDGCGSGSGWRCGRRKNGEDWTSIEGDMVVCGSGGGWVAVVAAVAKVAVAKVAVAVVKWQWLGGSGWLWQEKKWREKDEY
jgi:hypothetical protein